MKNSNTKRMQCAAISGSVANLGSYKRYEVELPGKTIRVDTDGTISNTRVYHINGSGRTVQIRAKLTSNGRFTCNELNATVHVNEIVRIADNFEHGRVESGEYCHNLPIDYCNRLGLSEVISPESGELAPTEQNEAQWALCERIRKETKLIVSCKPYTKAFSLLSVQTKLTVADVKQFRHINHGGWIEILE